MIMELADDKVYITGLNALTALGLGMDETWQGLLAGRSGVKRISLFDPASLETQIAAQLPDAFDEMSATHVKKRTARQMTRVTRMFYCCAKEAIEKHTIDFAAFDPMRVAVILGVVNTGNSSLETGTTRQNTILKGMNNAMSAWISLEYNIQGPNYTISTACASSAYAMAQGFSLIRQGAADLVITGGADSIINPEEIAGFNEMLALSLRNSAPEKASCPFSKDRDGFVIGEGAGVVILESGASAKRRGAKVYAELVGYALTSEAYNIMAPREGGDGMAITMRTALLHAGIKPEEVGYINAHGTSTILNDWYETEAIKKVFGTHASKLKISSSKSMIGHTIGAAGAIEGAVTAISLYNGTVHPTINLDTPDPELDLDYVPHGPQPLTSRYAISNSFGFGGHNATLVFGRVENS